MLKTTALSYMQNILSLLFMLASLAFMPAAHAAAGAQAGQVEFASPGVNATSHDGKTRTLQKGGAVLSGDTINTGTGQVQIRFTDGGKMSLLPDTQFRIDDYHFNGQTDGTEKGLFSLVKGGLRSITGAIGHVNKKNYRVETPVAVIGVRGTEYYAKMRGDLWLYCGVGSCVLTTESGELVLHAGECGKAANAQAAPTACEEQLTDKFDGTLPGEGPGYSSSEERDRYGNPSGYNNR